MYLIDLSKNLLIQWKETKKFPQKNLSQNRIGLWHTLKENELKKNRKCKTSKKEKEFFFKNLFKIGYSKKNQKDLNKNTYLKNVTKTFQRRFRQELIDGKIDRECLLISTNLLKKYN